MKCPNCLAQNPNGARFCMQCGTRLHVRCANCSTTLPATARFCLHCGQAVQASTAADAQRHTRLAAAAPPPLLAKTRAAQPLAGEQRIVTVLYIDVVDSTGLTARLGENTVALLLDDTFDRLAPIVYRYEGTIARVLGDSAWILFGLPLVHEDDPQRAVSAALDAMALVEQISAETRMTLNNAFQMRACLHTGPVVCTANEAAELGVTAQGPALNIAARLKFSAEPMAVYASATTHRFIAPLFDTQSRGRITIKGRAEPLAVHRVIGRKAAPAPLRGVRGLTSPMVGRDAELHTLVQLAQTVQAGVGRAVLINGEPGLGKTRLIDEWRRAVAAWRVPGVDWIVGHSRAYGRGLAYHLVIDLLRSAIGVSDSATRDETRAALRATLLDLLGDEMLQVYPYLGQLLSLTLEPEAAAVIAPLDPQALQTQYRQALERLLTALSGNGPLIVVLEDLHWLDPSSADILVELMPLVRGNAILFCLVTRPESTAASRRLLNAAREQVGSSVLEISLRPLDEPHSRQLVANLLEIEALPDAVRQLILDKAEGNPFFVEELIRMLIEREAIVRQDGGWVAGPQVTEIDIPDNLHGLLLARIDRLPPDVKQTLRLAAVVGRHFPLSVLAHILGETAHDPAQ